MHNLKGGNEKDWGRDGSTRKGVVGKRANNTSLEGLENLANLVKGPGSHKSSRRERASTKDRKLQESRERNSSIN